METVHTERPYRNFPGGPVAKISCPGFYPRSGSWTLHAAAEIKIPHAAPNN